MSWDRTEKEEVSKCACGKGTVVRIKYKEMDDWNQIREGIIEEEIRCDFCIKKYHIEHFEYNVVIPKWIGDGYVDKTYLIPNGNTLNYNITPKQFTGSFDEKIVMSFSIEEIDLIITEMKEKRYSTRLQQKESIDALKMYYSAFKKKSLTEIIPVLEKCKRDYKKYKWNKQIIEEYRKQEKRTIEENKRKIDDTLKKAVELEFN